MLEAGHGEVVCGEPEDAEGEGEAGSGNDSKVGTFSFGRRSRWVQWLVVVRFQECM